MEKFWKWLMKADAKGLFVASLLFLGGVTAWWGVDLVRAPRKAANASAADTGKEQPLDLSDFKPIGVIGFVSNQFAPETLIVPVNPFHPTFEAIVKALVRQSENGIITITDKDGRQREVHFENGILVDSQGTPVAAPFQRDLTPRQPGQGGQQPGDQRHFGQMPLWPRGQGNKPQPQPQTAPPKPKPQVSFKGVMQRPDGSYAAYISIKAERTQGRFVKVGDKLGNATVTASGRDGIELTFDDGTKATLGIGDAPVTVEPDSR
jgi:hypothetical protein